MNVTCIVRDLSTCFSEIAAVFIALIRIVCLSLKLPSNCTCLAKGTQTGGALQTECFMFTGSMQDVCFPAK